LEPALGQAFAGAIYYPDEAHCEPASFVRAIGRAAVEAGAEVRTRVEVLSLRTRGNRVALLQTTAGEITAETFVLAAGAWSTRLAADAGVFCPLEGGKGYHVDLQLADGDPQIPIYVQEPRVIATPFPGRLRLSGTLELAGLDLSVDERRVEAVVRGVERVLRGLAARPRLETWRGLRPCTPDGLPVIGPASEAQNLVLATGHAMMGLTLAPATGRLVAGLVTGAPASDELAAFRPDRFRAFLGF
jgi:D-amino-acid dehydrogenase